ncbi:MAG: hypothetical protein OHK0029_27540 [Armatimonadaceae bacterium]
MLILWLLGEDKTNPVLVWERIQINTSPFSKRNGMLRFQPEFAGGRIYYDGRGSQLPYLIRR